MGLRHSIGDWPRAICEGRDVATRYPASSRTASLGVALFAVLALAGPAAAQQETTPDGRLLDNNLRIGSGGYNEPVAPQNTLGQEIQARNSIITRNVGGLGYFHDDVDYRAPQDLRLRLPSDRLYRFRAQSAGPTYTPGDSLHQRQPLLIDRGPSTMRQYIDGGGEIGQAQTWDGSFRYRDFRHAPDAPVIVGRPADDTMLGLTQDERGRALQITASPLLGVQERTVTPIEDALAGHPSASMNTNPVPPNQFTQDPLAPAPQDSADVQGQPGSLSGAAAFQIQGRFDPATMGLVPGIAPAPRDSLAGAGAASALGAHLQGQVTAPRLGEDASIDRQLQQLEARMFNPAGTRQAKVGDDVYLDILRQIREAHEAAQGNARPAGPADQLAPAPEPAPILDDPPSPEELEAARNARRRAALVARGLIDPDEQPDAQSLERAEQQAEDQTPRPAGKLGEIISSIQTRLPAVSTLAGDDQSHVNAMMRKAESEMAIGKFLDAEMSYRGVVVANPDHTMARVGLVHAQLGAGLFRSAAQELRRLFDEHPELIGVQYSPALLPPASRLRWIRAELDRMLEKSDSPDPALLLAYMGYQLGQNEFLAYGLDTAEARAPRDPLLAVLRQVWLHGPTSPDQGGPTK